MEQNPKKIAGRRAAELVKTGTSLGLGTGSTVFYFLERLAERIREEGLEVRGVPTSVDTETKAREMGIPLMELEDATALDLTVDGADEIDGNFDMIKGGGGALLREKVVASITRREAIVVGPEKVVDRLGSSFLLPVEVAPFARAVVRRALLAIGSEPSLRVDESGETYLTDNGNEILDCRFPEGIADARATEREILAIPGVVECGLFVGLAHVLVIGHPDGKVEVRERI